MAARRSPSRARAASNCASACSARGGTASLQSSGPLLALAHRRSASATVRGAAWGSQAFTASCNELMRCSRRGAGSWRLLPSSFSSAARTSTLPRLSCAVSMPRNTGSRARSSSGRRNDRSRKRLFTERISSPSRRAWGARASVSAPVAEAPCCALAYPVML